MADGVTVKVDASNARAKFDHLTPAIRDRLRVALPDLANQLAARVDANLGALNSRNRLKTVRELHESTNQIYARVAVDWTGDSRANMVPQVLESGARPHVIEASGKALAFMWQGQMRFFKRVNHPGYPGIHYMRDAFAQMRDAIVEGLRKAAKQGASEARP